MKRNEQYQESLVRLFPEVFRGRKTVKTVTFQVTDACNLACTYCYQTHKGHRKMSFDVAKKFVDLLLSGEKGFHEYINPEMSPGLIVEFIGGEPLLEVELIDQILDYLMQRLIEMKHPWMRTMMVSMISNGTLYKEEKVQRFLNKWKYRLSFAITIDGNKELHDSCRIFPDGRKTYDIAVSAAQDWIKRGNHMGSKITIAPENVMHVYDAIAHMIRLGYKDINANCVYEKGWTMEHAKILYSEMKQLADFFIENDIDLNKDMSCSLFNENMFKPKIPGDDQNWCGGVGSMLACDPDGELYPCIRYMESSLGESQEPFSIGDLEEGICQNECTKCRRQVLDSITRRTQSTDECYNCPIAEGCSWCSAYNYQIFGTPDKRATFICEMHKARALANVYYWNQLYKKNGNKKRMMCHIPEEWAVNIVTKEEYERIRRETK